MGHLLRKTKIDELPQLFNVLRGEMSLVGPRPEIPDYVDRYQEDFTQILTVRPGMTDLASLQFVDEQAILAESANPEQTYLAEILPMKIELAKDYIARRNIFLDLHIILNTFIAIFRIRMKARGVKAA